MFAFCSGFPFPLPPNVIIYLLTYIHTLPVSEEFLIDVCGVEDTMVGNTEILLWHLSDHLYNSVLDGCFLFYNIQLKPFREQEHRGNCV